MMVQDRAVSALQPLLQGLQGSPTKQQRLTTDSGARSTAVPVQGTVANVLLRPLPRLLQLSSQPAVGHVCQAYFQSNSGDDVG